LRACQELAQGPRADRSKRWAAINALTASSRPIRDKPAIL
jgi:hypothetical protein